MGYSAELHNFFIESRLADAGRGDSAAYFELGMAYSSGTSDTVVDLIQAHKWFNLAALGGSTEAQGWRAEIAEEMSAREIAEAQKQAQILRGTGDAEASRIYAQAISQDPQFYVFYRSLEAYRQAMGSGDTTYVLTPNSDFFRFFEKGPVPRR